jgi:hypothetical protein
MRAQRTLRTGGAMNIPAFPCHPDIDNKLYDGMTLRDYFAAKALPVVMPNNRSYPMDAARAAYEFADAMMKAREA